MSGEIFQDHDLVNVECPNCLEDIPANYLSLNESKLLTCGECGFTFAFDINDLNRKVNAAMRKIIGNQPPDPDLN